MKKHTTKTERRSTPVQKGAAEVRGAKQAEQIRKAPRGRLTIGLDLGDRANHYCVLEGHPLEECAVVEEGTVATDKQALRKLFGGFPASLVGLEVGTHSPWISRLVEELGHEVVVANPRRVKLISESTRKTDRTDAEMLARIARADRTILRPIQHRGEEAQADLIGIRVRAKLVEMRTEAINVARGLTKSYGERLAKCDADTLSREQAKELPAAIRSKVERLLRVVEVLTEEIEEWDQDLAQLSKEQYREETARLEQVQGVGKVTAMTFILTLEDSTRFAKSRDVGCYVGLRPKNYQSSTSNPEMRISKEGDVYLRQLLVQSAQYILSVRGEDTDLKRWGLKIAAKGKKNAKKRAVVAVARKLAVLLHRLWVSGEKYEPRRQGDMAMVA